MTRGLTGLAVADAYAAQTGALADLDQQPTPPDPEPRPAPHPHDCTCAWHREAAA